MARQRSGIRLRKLADYSRGRRYDAAGNALESWPLLGVIFESPPADHIRVPEKVILQGYREGWIELEGVEQVIRPAGPPHAPWAGKTGAPGQNHTFIHATAAIFHMVDGDWRYAVAANPDKLHPNRVKTGGDVEGGAVAHYYDLDLEARPKSEES